MTLHQLHSLVFLIPSPNLTFSDATINLIKTNEKLSVSANPIERLKAKERIRELERELESLQQKLGEQEDKSNKMYLHMYAKEQEGGASTSKVVVES